MSSLPELLRRSAMRAADAEAVVQGAARTSYGSLWADAAACGRFFQGERLPDGARVALLMSNSAAYVAACYGVWCAGGVTVALNAAARAADVARWLDHSEAEWLIVDGRHPELPRLLERRPLKPRLLIAGKPPEGLVAASWDEMCASYRGTGDAFYAGRLDELAAIIYTSGTTGRPKGVMLSHGNLAANVSAILAYLPVSAASRIVNVLPFYYSYGNSVLHTHLAAGGCLVLEDNLLYPHRVLERMEAERADGFAGVPATYGLLLNRVRFEDYDLSTLKYLTVAGGAMPPADVQRLADKLPQARMFVMYGQTEATARLTYLPPEWLREKAGSCGVPVRDVEIDVRGEDGRPAPPGVAGEVWVRGPNVMLGYWRDPEATRAALRDGWLRTGDMGHRTADGYLYLQGRRGDMIKTGAHRIHPREIEEVVAEVDGVAEVAAVGVDDELLGQVIKVAVRMRPGAAADAMRIKAHCRERLAPYKIPKYVEFVQELPKTASGKIQRYLLAGGGERGA